MGNVFRRYTSSSFWNCGGIALDLIPLWGVIPRYATLLYSLVMYAREQMDRLSLQRSRHRAACTAEYPTPDLETVCRVYLAVPATHINHSELPNDDDVAFVQLLLDSQLLRYTGSDVVNDCLMMCLVTS